jgi:hypothetical protein
MAGSFTMVGKIVPIKDSEKFKGYEEMVFASKWMTQKLRWNFVCGDDRHLVEINAGRWQDDAKNSTIYTMSRATATEKSKKIQIPWEKRNDPDTIATVAGYRVFTVDTDTREHREEVKNSGDAKAIEDSLKKEKHFLASSDFCDWAKKVVYSEKAKDMVFKIQGNIVHSYSEKTGKYYSAYEVNKIYRVDENTEPYSNASIEFYYAEDFMDKEYVEENGKAIMSGFTPFYDSVTKKNWFAPISLVMREDKDVVDVTEDVLSDFDSNEICKTTIACKVIDGAQKVDIKVTDLSEKVQKAIAAGIMDEKTAIRNAGGQAYGDKIQEIRFDKISKSSEATAYTLEDCMKKPCKEEENVDIFADSNDDNDDEDDI